MGISRASVGRRRLIPRKSLEEFVDGLMANQGSGLLPAPLHKATVMASAAARRSGAMTWP